MRKNIKNIWIILGHMTLLFSIICLLCACSSANEQNESQTDTVWNGVTAQTSETPAASGTLPQLHLTSNTKYSDVTRDSYTDAAVTIQGTDYKGAVCDYSGDIQIKLRGNSTANRPKIPFKIKFDEKVDLFDMGKSKHWVLLANDIDHTHMRNKLLNDFSGALGTETYMESTWVDLYYNDVYMGIYQLCEHIRVGNTRIDIFDWDSLAETAAKAIVLETGEENPQLEADLEEAMQQSYTWIDTRQVYLTGHFYTIPDSVQIPDANGGFVLEMDFYSEWDNSLAKTLTPYRQPLYFNTPEPADPEKFSDTALYKYAFHYITSFEYALHSDDFFFRNSDTHYSVAHRGTFNAMTGWNAEYTLSDYADDENDGKHYSQLFDLDSLVNNFIFCEYAMNWDSMKNSFHLYKDLNTLAQIGPQWDFDWAWGNRNMFGIDTYITDQWHSTCLDFTREQYYQSVQWNTQLIRDPYFLVRAFEKYKLIRPTIIENMISEGGTIDTYTQYLQASADTNDTKWSGTYMEYGGEPFNKAVDSMKTFLTKRVDWLDKQFKDLPAFIASLGVYKPSPLLSVTDITTQEDGSCTITAAIADNRIAAVVFQINGITQLECRVQNQKASVTVPHTALTDGSCLNVVEIKGKGPDGKYLYDTAASKPFVYNLVVSNYKTW